MSSKEQKRYAMEQVRKVEAILRRWDPLEVLPGESAPADEYQLLAHLSQLRTEAMGMPANLELDKEAAEEIFRAITR